MKKRLLSSLVFLFLILPFISVGQVNVKDSAIFTPIAYATYGFYGLGGDISDMFGPSSTIGAGLGFKTKSNIYFGFEYNYLWGGKVKQGDEILQQILTNDGQLIAQSGEYAIFQFMQRGHMIWGHIGKLIPILSPNPNSGFMIRAGVGYVQHKMFISVQDNNALQVDGDYKKGYDRLHGGLGLDQFIGYMYMGNTRIWNFYVGFECSQAWTRNMRDVNFDTGLKDDQVKFDLFYGLKVGWILPLYRRAPEAYYFN